MTCAGCGTSNAAGAKFCCECGQRLARTCAQCGAALTGRFCSECGTPADAGSVATAAPASPSPEGAPFGSGAERRITSVLFGDLVGFTTLSEARDPDDVRELLSRYFAACRTVVERYGGVVEKFIGDAVMAVWGVPATHEDDAERAVRAGFDLIDAVHVLGEEVGTSGLAMRVGVVTGEVAVNLGATGEGMVAGDAVNTASRIQSLAAPGRVWVDDQTRRLTTAAISYDDQGEHALKGKTDPVHLFSARQVVAAVGGARRVDGLEAPFVGRDHELRLVKELFHATLEEQRPRLVAVFGAAGIGKSRLGWEFDKYFDGINAVVMGHRGRCLSYGDGAAFWALAEMVQGRLGILEGDSADVVVERLRTGLDLYVPDATDRAWLLPRMATLLGVIDQVAAGSAFARDDLFAAWRTFLEHVARHDDAVGAVLRVEDLQWADPGLLDFLDHLVETAMAPIFILTLSRSELTERAPSFGTGRRSTALHLEPLADAAMASLLDGLVEGLPTRVRTVLAERAEGVPLFAVETIRALIDKDVVIPRGGRYVLATDGATRIDLDDASLPTSLHTLIASRLDNLTPGERRAVQDASVLGQSFTQRGLAALAAAVGDDIDVDASLAALVRKEIFAIDADPRSPERGQYRFVQAMVRTVAYESLSRRDRKVRHVVAAEHLAAEPDADTIPAVIASHYLDAHACGGSDDDVASLAARAVELLERAATRARGVGAPGEARRHLEAALRLVEDKTAAARLTEACAEAALAAGSPDAAALAQQAREVYAGLGRDLDAARALALWGEAQLNAGLGQSVVEPLAAAYEQLATDPEAAGLAARLALAVARGYYLSKGDSQAAIPWFDRAVSLCEALEDFPLLTATLASYAGALVLVGRHRMGLGLLRVSLDLAREVGDPAMQLRPLNNLMSFLATRDVEAACGYAKEALPIARRVGEQVWQAYLAASSSSAFYYGGRWDEAVALISEFDELEDRNPTLAMVAAYAAAIQEARGLPVVVPEIAEAPTGQRSDVVLLAVQDLLMSYRLREAGERRGAAAASASAARQFVTASGIDDDFAFFWTVAVADQVAAGDVVTVRQLLAPVADAPRGHVSPLLRALLPWMRVRVALLAGDDGDVDVDASFLAAETALREFGAVFFLGQSLLEHAEWLERGHRGPEAQPLRAEAHELFTALGAEPWSARAAGPAGAAHEREGAAAGPAIPGAPAGR